jgi:hypothetical protein
MNARRTLLALSLLAAFVAAGFGTGGGAAVAGIVPTPAAPASGDTPPPITATATPKPSGTLVRYSSQILDDRAGYVVFVTGDAFRLDPDVKVVDAQSGGPTQLQAQTRTYARASFDTGTGRIVELALSAHKLPDEATYDAIKPFVVALHAPYPNPDLRNNGEGFNGRPVLVVFTVEVPSKTPFGDVVYIATDVSGWSATALRMDRVDALHYRLTLTFNSGTRFLYRYTRGSWRSAERGQNGLEVSPRSFVVRNGDVKSKNDVVYAWGDQDAFAPDLGSSIPTPFNPVPFVTPPRH